MDMSWTRSSRNSPEYEKGVHRFIDYLVRTEAYEGKIRCPCRIHKSARFMDVDDVIGDLFFKGIERCHIPNEHDLPHNEHVGNAIDNMQGMLNDALGHQDMADDDTIDEEITVDENHTTEYDPEYDPKMYEKLHIFASQDLYPGCSKFTTLSFIIKLLHIKCANGWSHKSFKMLLDLLGEVLPDGHTLPSKFSQYQKIIRDLSLDYTTIDACENNCVLYWRDNAMKTHCPTCGRPRWKQIGKTKVSEKSMRYFPLAPRLQRLFTSEITAKEMRWHNDERKDDGLLRHPADSEAWKRFDQLHANFASEIRNVRLGLASDGMNPFGNMSITYSTWPVILIPYNLPPWVCMKSHNFILSMVIPGPQAPGNDIDVYLQPLVEELKELWDNGVETYDAYSKQKFKLRAALLWTINDFPAYGNLSGWSTKGELACPVCNKDVTSTYLEHSRKHCYTGHRRFLHMGDKMRSLKKAFYGEPDWRPPIKCLSGSDVLEQLENLPPIKFGYVDSNTNKKRKRRRKRRKLIKYLGWTKKSIFFELPYWRTNLLRHNLDVMHIEKNISEIILGTLMNIPDKTKDNLKARLDLVNMGIRNELHPYKQGDRYKYPPATYTMDTDQKTSFCKFLMDVRFPDSYASNISRCVKVAEQKVLGLKSHDHHVMLQQLMPIAVRDLLPKNVADVVVELGMFFRELCSKTLNVNVLLELDEQIVQTLCKLEMIFPPTFFVVMMHLPVHLAREARLGGPVQYRWMYPVERYMHTLRHYMRNKARPEASIAEGYIADECLTFCSRYLRGIETRFNRPERNDDGIRTLASSCLSVFASKGRPVVGGHPYFLTLLEVEQIHYYVLQNCAEIHPYIEEFKDLIGQFSASNPLFEYEKTFTDWFKQRVSQEDVTTELKQLAYGPQRESLIYDTYNINGYRFSTESYQLNRKTQNFGVQVNDSEEVYYGTIQQIVDVPYQGSKRVVLFKCKWFDLEHEQGYKMKDGIESVNTKRTSYADQPYILASQAMQVFYVKEIKNSNWSVVVKTQPRSYYNMSSNDQLDIELLCDNDPCQQDVNLDTSSHLSSSRIFDDEELDLVRTDIPHLID